MYKSILNMEYEICNDACMASVIEEMGRGRLLQKKLGDRATILGVGLIGPMKNSIKEQLDRTRVLKINMCNNLFYGICVLRGLRDLNRPIILKKKNGEFLNSANKATTVHEVYRNMYVDGDSTGTGTGRPPFAALVPIRSGKNEDRFVHLCRFWEFHQPVTF